MDPSPSLGAQNLNIGKGTQNNNTGTGSQFIAHAQYFDLPPGRLGNEICLAALTVIPEPLESPPSPSCEIPFPRDLDFVDRGTLLDQINEKCSTPASWTALVGLGGVGYVEIMPRLVVAVNAGTGSRSWPSSTAIAPPIDHQIRGYFGCTRVTQRDLNRVTKALQTASRCLGGTIQR